MRESPAAVHQNVRSCRSAIGAGQDSVAREVAIRFRQKTASRGRQALVQREHVASLRSGDEIVGVLDARGDRLELAQRPDRIVLQPGCELAVGNWGKNRQISRTS